MASTIEITKEEYVQKYSEKGFNFFGLMDITYEILIKKKLSDDLETVWFNAYVKLAGDLKPNYCHESFRNDKIIGVDTSDLCSYAEHYKREIVRERIIGVIKEHHGYYTKV